MQIHYVLIDFENVHVKSLAALQDECFRVDVFLGPSNVRLPRDLVLPVQKLGERAKYVVMGASGPNALDFHIAYHLGRLASADPDGFFHVISADTAFDALLDHMRTNGLACARSTSIEAMPCFQPSSVVAGSPKAAQDELLQKAIQDLRRRGEARPARMKTLQSTLHAALGDGHSLQVVQSLIQALIGHGYVRQAGTRIAYSLPPAAEPGN